MKINKFVVSNLPYLRPLLEVERAPAALYGPGALPTERRPSVAIVGSRKPTRYGVEVTTKLAGELAGKGVVVISGLALGVDGIAHTAALDAGGTTIAILGNSLPRIYPASHRGLAERIVANDGAVLSEYEAGVEPRDFQFLWRNRLVSGLSDAIVITEAARSSGTLNTAAHALRQGKEVFVVPGNITSPLSAGCNALLRQGATPVTAASDIIEVIAPELLSPQTSLPLGDTPEQVTIIGLLQQGIRDGDELQQRSALDAALFNQTLTMLELGGAIRALGGNQWTLR